MPCWSLNSSHSPSTPSHHSPIRLTTNLQQDNVTEEDQVVSITDQMNKTVRKLCQYIIDNRIDKINLLLKDKEINYINKLLLETQIKMTRGTDIYNTPLNFACETSSKDICACLFAFIQNKELFQKEFCANCTSAIHCAARNTTTDILHLMHELGVFDDKMKNNINLQSKLGNTPLHFACSKGNAETVKWLLQNGANHSIENRIDELPLHWAASGGDVPTFNEIYQIYEKQEVKVRKSIKDYSVEEGMDDSEKKLINKYKKNPGEKCLKIEAQNLGVPLLFAAKELRFDCVAAIFDKQKEADGTPRDDEGDTALHFLGKTADPIQLAKTLKANALLGVKNLVGNVPLDWIKKETLEELLNNHIKKIIFPQNKVDVSKKDQYNILFTNLFGHHASGSDMKNILAIANSREHEELALHPVCQSIVAVKWQKISKYFFLKLLFFIPFVVMLTLYPILLSDKDFARNNTHDLRTAEKDIVITWYTLYLLLIIQVIFGTLSVFVLIRPFLRESKSYLSQNDKKLATKRLLEYYYFELIWSDWYEYLVWILAFLLLHDCISPISVVIISWFSLFLVCSNHPSILPLRYILVKILIRYFKFLVFAFGLISGFAMGFFLLLRECKVLNGGPCADGAFQSVYSSALKVPAMMMGEISFETFQQDLTSPYIYFLFGGFIFLITCCLFNMMNGLAINITQEMMQKAHIYKTIAECEMIYEFEILLTEVSAWVKWFGFREISLLSPLWVERLKASPSSGKCKNLDEYNEDIHGSILNSSIKTEDLWETNKAKKTKWIWIDRGYELDRKIIYKANAIICNKAEFVYKDPADVESADEDDGDVGSITPLFMEKQKNINI